MEEYLEIGIVYPMIYPNVEKDKELKNIETLVKDNFFSILEISKFKNEMENKGIKLLKNSKIKIVYSIIGDLIANRLNLNSLDEDLREKSIDFVKGEIDTAKKYKSKYLTLISGEFLENKIEEHLNQLRKSLDEIARYTKEVEGPEILLEAFDSKIDKKVLIGSNHLAKKLFENIDCTKIGLLVDLSHIPMLGEEIKETIFELREYIKHVHIGNTILNQESSLYGDYHPRFGHEDGENDIEEIEVFLKSLIQIGYINKMKKATLSFEVKPYGEEESEVILANCKRSLRKAWINCIKEGELI